MPFERETLDAIQTGLGYTFRDVRFLETAFTHPSYVNEHHNTPSNQRLEFLGDSVVNFVAAHYLYQVMPMAQEGTLTTVRAGAVSTKALASLTDSMGLIEYLRIGTGSKANEVRRSEKVRADLFEAICGAIFLDGGYESAVPFILGRLQGVLDRLRQCQGVTNARSRLQEAAQRQGIKLQFKEGKEEGGFVSTVMLEDGRCIGKGRGHNKKEAAHAAAQNALDTHPEFLSVSSSEVV